MDAIQTSELLLTLIRESNLNFSIIESPFSLSVNLKKTYIRDKNGVPRRSGLENLTLRAKKQQTISFPWTQTPVPPQTKDKNIIINLEHQNRFLVNENYNLKKYIEELELVKRTSEEAAVLLNQKLVKADTSARESYKNKSEENLALKVVIKNRNQDLEDLKKEFINKGKVIKDKEKELYRLDQKCTNLEECSKKIKIENKDLKAEIKKVLKDKTREASKSNSVPIRAVSAISAKSAGTLVAMVTNKSLDNNSDTILDRSTSSKSESSHHLALVKMSANCNITTSSSTVSISHSTMSSSSFATTLSTLSSSSSFNMSPACKTSFTTVTVPTNNRFTILNTDENANEEYATVNKTDETLVKGNDEATEASLEDLSHLSPIEQQVLNEITRLLKKPYVLEKS